MTDSTRAKLASLLQSAHLFLLKPTKVWVAVAVGVVGLVLGGVLF